MKRLVSAVLIFCMVLSLCSVVQAASSVALQFYVNPVTGSDSASGTTASAPFKTVERAMEAVRSYIAENNGTMTGDIVVNLGEGRYELDDYLQFTEADSGKNGHKIIYQGAGAKKSVISGGKEISGWEQQGDGLWVAHAPELEFARDLYINDKPARRAASQKMIKGVANYIASDSYYDLSDGFYINKSQMPKFNNPEDVIFHWTIAWRDFHIAVKEIIDDPSNNERLIVKLENPIWDAMYAAKDLPSTRVRLWPTFDKEFVVENALELLDEPGEFYFDKNIKKLYYYPRENENMATAQVIVPVLERLMRIDGRDNYHQISGLTFKNIGFAHATNPIAENSSYVNQQGEFPICPQAAGNLTPGTVEVNYANSIEFADCSVWGTELVGIALYEGVDNSTIRGCSITDTGSAAAVIGTCRNSWSAEPADRTAAANVVYLKRWRASYNYVAPGGGTMAFFNGGSTGNEFEYRSGEDSKNINAHMWKNEPWAERDGIKSWVMFDLERAHKLESIRLSFEEDSVGVKASDVERSNFEVLVSNDEDFSDYEVVKTFTEPAADVEEFPVNLEESYRYLMVRKTKAEPFAIFGVWAYSHDREPLGRLGLCENVTFENNYIARAGRIHNQAPAVLVHITKGTSVRQNEIVDSSYTGISLGWGWENVNYTATDNVIENNLIENCSLFTDDGGGIYILGNQKNLQIKGNYVKNQGNMYGGIYFDTGSCGATVENNVVVNTSNTFMFWNDVNAISRGPIKLRNNYSDMSQVARYDGDAYIDWEDINVFTPDNPPANAVSIMTNAGVQAAYRSIREAERVETPWLKGPDMAKSYHRTMAASTRALAYISVAENLLANGQFGELPWQFSYDDYFAIQKALADIKDSSNRTTDYSNGHILEEYALKAAIENAYDGIEHPSYSQMVKMCEAYISGADTSGGLGSYPQSAIADLKTALGSEKASVPRTEVDKAMAACRLEKAVWKLEQTRIGADMEYAYVQSGKTDVDRENKTIIITLPFEAALTGLDVKTVVSQGAELATDISKADFSNPLAVTVKNKAMGGTNQWTLEIKNETVNSVQNLVPTTTSQNWINLNPNTVMPVRVESMTIQPAYEPYIYKTAADNSVEWKVQVDNSDSNNEIDFIFGGKRKNIEPGVKETGNSYYRLVLSKKKMILYNVQDGVQGSLALGAKADSGFVYGKVNTIKAAMDGNNLKVYVNDAQIMSVSLSGKRSFKGYCGIYNPNSTVKLVSSNYQVKLTNVALNRPVFASWTADINEPERMTDGKMDTAWVSNKFVASGKDVIDGSYLWALVDLGAEYSIDRIKIFTENNSIYASRDRQNYKVYVTNTRPDTNVAPNTAVSVAGMTEVYSAPSVANGADAAPAENVIDVAAVEATEGNRYRYVFLQKSNVPDSNGGKGHWYWKINEIEVDTSDAVAESAPYWIEIAKNKPAFSGEVYESDSYAARNAIDGSISTAFIASDWSSGIKSRLVVDLEAEYPIESVVFTPRYTGNELKGYEIYATNDTLFEDMTLIHKQPNDKEANYGHLYYKAPDSMKGKKFRYIVVQADNANNNLAVLDLKAYTSDKAARKSVALDRTYLTSVNCGVVSDGGESETYLLKNITDNDSATTGLFSSGKENGYIAVDLLVPQSVDYVTYAIEGFGLYHYGLEIVAANKADLSDGVVMFSAKDENGNYFCPVSETDTKGILLFPATAEMSGNKYRYVGMRFPKNLNTSNQIVRGGATMFGVYTKGSNLVEALSGATAALDGTTVNLAINDFLTNGDLTYTVVAAGYDRSGRLVDAKTAKIKNANQLVRNTKPVTATVNFDNAEKNSKIETVRVMLWDNGDNNIRPIIPEINLETESYAVVESSAEVTSYYYQYGSINGTNPTETRFTDNDLNTVGGRGQHWDVAWVDLGERKWLEAAGGIVNDTVNVLSYPIVVYVTNDDPGAVIAQTIKDNGRFVAPTGWIAVNGDGYLLTKTGRTDLFFKLAEPGDYRYVILAAPTADFVNDNSLPGLPAYISEIAGYKKALK